MGESEKAALARARARTLAELEVARVEGKLDASEFERRVTRARSATSPRDLEHLLPEPPHERPLPSVADTAPLELGDEAETLVSIMTGVKRTGVWEPPETLRVFCLMGGVELDFRQAEFLEGVTELVVWSLMGGVNIVAPPGIDVESDGFALMGEFRHLVHRSPHSNSPLLRVRGFSLMAGVDVKIKK